MSCLFCLTRWLWRGAFLFEFSLFDLAWLTWLWFGATMVWFGLGFLGLGFVWVVVLLLRGLFVVRLL